MFGLEQQCYKCFFFFETHFSFTAEVMRKNLMSQKNRHSSRSDRNSKNYHCAESGLENISVFFYNLIILMVMEVLVGNHYAMQFMNRNDQ